MTTCDRLFTALVTTSLLVLAGCGGGGGSSSPAPVVVAPPATGGGSGTGGTGGGSGSGTGGDAGSGDSAADPATGNFTLLVTDGPSEEFQQILVTVAAIRLIGADADSADAVVLDDPVDIDLLELESVSNLLASTDLATGTYNKLRLTITALTLNRIDADGNITDTVSPDLPANGRIDLQLDEPLEVSTDSATVLELDIDAARSFRFTGNGSVRFRPVLFAKRLDADNPGKPVRGRGVIDTLDLAASSLIACRLQDPGSNSDGDDQRCATVTWNDNTAFVQPDGSAGSANDLQEGATIGVTGLATRSDTGVVIAARTILLGDPAALSRLDGTALTAVAEDGQFQLQLDEALDGSEDSQAITVATSGLTRFFSRKGRLLEADAVVPGVELEVAGQLDSSDPDAPVLSAVAVVINEGSGREERGSKGALANVDLAGQAFDLERGRFSQCVQYSADTRIGVLEETDDGSTVTAADPADALVDGRRAEVSGSLGDTCLEADTIIVKLRDDDDDDDDDDDLELELAGRVSSFDPDTGALTLVRGDSTACVLVTSETELDFKGRIADDEQTIQVDDFAKAEGEVLDAGCLVAEEVKIRRGDADDDDDLGDLLLVDGTLASVDLDAGRLLLDQDGAEVCVLLADGAEVLVRTGDDLRDADLADFEAGQTIRAAGFSFFDGCLVAEKVVRQRDPFAVAGTLADFGPEGLFFVTPDGGGDTLCFVIDEDAEVRLLLADGSTEDDDDLSLQDHFNRPVLAQGPEFVVREDAFSAQCLLATTVTVTVPDPA